MTQLFTDLKKALQPVAKSLVMATTIVSAALAEGLVPGNDKHWVAAAVAAAGWVIHYLTPNKPAA